MRTSHFVLSVFFTLTAMTGQPPAADAHDPQAIHGMLLAGTGQGTVFLSHLPMFHSPHDYQAIYEARFNAADQYAADRASTQERLYTIVPEKMDLTEVGHGIRSFKADVYRGHFERGGTMITQGARFEIVRIVYFKKFDPGAAHPQAGTYLFFGNTNESFLAHEITARPDFDQIIEVTASGFPPVDGARELVFQSLPSQSPMTEGITLTSGVGRALLQVTANRVCYYETGDLE